LYLRNDWLKKSLTGQGVIPIERIVTELYLRNDWLKKSLTGQGVIPIERIVTENVPLCEELNEMLQATQ
jgi:hypothetical protein